MPRRRHPRPLPNRRRGAHAHVVGGRRPGRPRPRDAGHGAPRPAVVPAHVLAEIDAMLAASYAPAVPASAPRVELDRADRVRITVADPRGGPDRRITALEALGL